MFLSRNKKNNVYPCKSQFYYIKVGFKEIKIIRACFRDAYDYDISAESSLTVFLFVFMHTETLLKWGLRLKQKNLLPL